MAGEESAAAADTGSEGASDTGTEDTSSTSAEGASEGAEGGSSEPAAQKYRVRLFGKEAEHTAEEMAKMLDDDYEWNFHGVAGKPLMQDGKPLTRKWRDIARDVASAKGAADAARRHNEERKRLEALKAWGKAPENRVAFMQRELGIEDFDSWALERAAESFNKRQKMVQLATTDPVAYERELRAEREQADKLRRESESRLEQQQKQEAERQEREQRFYGTVGEHLSKVGVPLHTRTREMVDQVCRDYHEAGAELSFEDLATIVRDLWHEEIFGYLDPKSDEDLLKLFGDKRRERLRKAEIAAMKGAKKAAAAPPASAQPKTPPSNGKREKGLTAEEFMRQSRNGGRV